jgi:hypothetical protein
MSQYRTKVATLFESLPQAERQRLREKYDFGTIETAEGFLLTRIAADADRFNRDRATQAELKFVGINAEPLRPRVAYRSPLANIK